MVTHDGAPAVAAANDYDRPLFASHRCHCKSASSPLVSFGELIDTTIKGLTSLLSVEIRN
jgi:hypothetical protein